MVKYIHSGEFMLTAIQVHNDRYISINNGDAFNEDGGMQVIKDIISLITDVNVNVNVDENQFISFKHVHDIPVFIKLYFSTKTNKPYISIRSYKVVKDNGVKESVIKKNHHMDENYVFDLVKINNIIDDVVKPIILCNNKENIINQQSEIIRNMRNTVLSSKSRNVDISFKNRGDINSNMTLMVRDLEQDEVSFMLSMLSLVYNG